MSYSVLENSFKSESAIKPNPKKITIGVGCRLKIKDAKLITIKEFPIKLSKESPAIIENSYSFLQSCIDQRIPIYGVNTHFGDQVNFLDPHLKNNNAPERYYESIKIRQQDLIKSHACGLGDVLDSEIVKVAMMLRVHCLSQGYSGVTPNLIKTILDYINNDITPIVRCYGSIGASGDLIPLAMIASAMMGEEVDVLYQGAIMKAPVAIAKAGLEKLRPECRDGLALINGTSLMTAIASLALYDLHRAFKQMLYAIAMSLEAMLVIESAYNPLVHQLKNHRGENLINNFLLDFWKESQLLTNLDELRRKSINLMDSSPSTQKPLRPVQDYYSLRAVAQGFGPFYENLERATLWIENEMNSINDNPIIDREAKKIHHGANFMGYYVTDACDMLKMNIAQASTWIHALLANLVHPRKNHHLPANLVNDPGTHNGFRPLQLLAAALAVQNRKLAQTQQSFMIPTEGDNQDVNSLGTHAAIDLRESVANLDRLVAILLLASTQALEFRGIEKASAKARTIQAVIREQFEPLTNCRPLSDEIDNIVQLLKNEKI